MSTYTFTRTANRITINDHIDDQPDPYRLVTDTSGNLILSNSEGKKWYINVNDDTIIINDEEFSGTADELKTELYSEVFYDKSGEPGGGLGYSVYAGLLTQEGTNAPEVIILQNTIGNIIWTRDSAGKYLATLENAFLQDKTLIPPFTTFGGDATTWIPIWAGTGAILGYYTIFYWDEDSTALWVKQPDGTSVDLSALITSSKLSIEIKVYP